MTVSSVSSVRPSSRAMSSSAVISARARPRRRASGWTSSFKTSARWRWFGGTARSSWTVPTIAPARATTTRRVRARDRGQHLVGPERSGLLDRDGTQKLTPAPAWTTAGGASPASDIALDGRAVGAIGPPSRSELRTHRSTAPESPDRARSQTRPPARGACQAATVCGRRATTSRVRARIPAKTRRHDACTGGPLVNPERYAASVALFHLILAAASVRGRRWRDPARSRQTIAPWLTTLVRDVGALALFAYAIALAAPFAVNHHHARLRPLGELSGRLMGRRSSERASSWRVARVPAPPSRPRRTGGRARSRGPRTLRDVRRGLPARAAPAPRAEARRRRSAGRRTPT